MHFYMIIHFAIGHRKHVMSIQCMLFVVVDLFKILIHITIKAILAIQNAT